MRCLIKIVSKRLGRRRVAVSESTQSQIIIIRLLLLLIVIIILPIVKCIPFRRDDTEPSSQVTRSHMSYNHVQVGHEDKFSFSLSHFLSLSLSLSLYASYYILTRHSSTKYYNIILCKRDFARERINKYKILRYVCATAFFVYVYDC